NSPKLGNFVLASTRIFKRGRGALAPMQFQSRRAPCYREIPSALGHLPKSPGRSLPSKGQRNQRCALAVCYNQSRIEGQTPEFYWLLSGLAVSGLLRMLQLYHASADRC